MARIPKGGMYGAAVFTVVLVAAMFIVFLSDVQEETRDVVRYDYVTEITGLFGSDESPQYFDYDLSQSYTGYYTDDSTPYFGGATAVTTAGQTIYDGMTEDINSTGKVNSYRLRLPEDVVFEADDYKDDAFGNHIDVSDPPGEGTGISKSFIFASYGSTGATGTLPYNLQHYFNNGPVEILGSYGMAYSDLQQLWSIKMYGVREDIGLVGSIAQIWELNHGDNNVQGDYVIVQGTAESGTHNTWFVGSVDDYKQVNSAVYAIAYTEKDYYDSASVKPTFLVNGVSYEAPIAAHSFIADLKAGTVALYSEYVITEDSVPLRTIPIEKAMVIHNDSLPWEIVHEEYSMGALTPVHARFYDQVYAYLDVSKGVRVSSGTD